jgi:hypothetical protein
MRNEQRIEQGAVEVEEDPFEEEFLDINEYYKFENEGDTLVGELIGFQPNASYVAGENRVKGQFLLLTSDNIVRFNWSAQLDCLRAMATGARVKITFDGQVKIGGGHTVNQFKIGIPKRLIVDRLALSEALGSKRQALQVLQAAALEDPSAEIRESRADSFDTD